MVGYLWPPPPCGCALLSLLLVKVTLHRLDANLLTSCGISHPCSLHQQEVQYLVASASLEVSIDSRGCFDSLRTC